MLLKFYEHRTDPLLPKHAFRRRVAHHGAWAFGLLLFSLALGTTGFFYLGHEQLADAFLNASMLLGGMGPIGPMERWDTPGKLFAAVFALYAGLAFIGISGFLLAPFAHRVLHRFHLEEQHRRARR
jgi:hypothetical protein